MLGDDYRTVCSLNPDFYQRDHMAPFTNEAEIVEPCEIERARNAGKQGDVTRFVKMPAPWKILGYEQLKVVGQLASKLRNAASRATIIERANDCLCLFLKFRPADDRYQRRSNLRTARCGKSGRGS